jgi:5-methylcytosine-specific restriction endonuclease McrA
MLGRCLVLNNSYEFLDVASWFDALCLLIENKATTLAEYSDTVRSQHMTWKVPAVMVMRYYVHTKKRKNTFGTVNKRNLLVRDGFKCQYCGAALSMRNGTVDHVFPKARGGTHTLTNTVASCKICNNAKGDMLLADFERKTGMTLRTTPRALTEEEKIDCLLKTVKSKERNAWVDCLKENNISLY